MPLILGLLLPLAAGLSRTVPLIALFLATIAANIAQFFIKFFTARTAIGMTIITVVVLLTVAVFVAMKTLVASISLVTPDYFDHAMSLIIPWNLPICAAAVISAKIIRWVWEWNIYFIHTFVGSAP